MALGDPQEAVSWNDARNQESQTRHNAQWQYGYPHHSPGSVLVASVGVNWDAGCFEAVMDCVEFARSKGYEVWFQEIRDSMMLPPFEGIQGMRDEAVLTAQARGLEYLCLIENDVKPTPDLLVRMLQREAPVLAPRMLHPDGEFEGTVIGYPKHKADIGLQPMRFVAFSWILFKTTVFNCFQTPPFTAYAHHSEGQLAAGLARYGHRIFMDTGANLELTRGPAYNHENYVAYVENMHRADKGRRQRPDRKPVIHDGPVIGETYAPWTRKGND